MVDMVRPENNLTHDGDSVNGYFPKILEIAPDYRRVRIRTSKPMPLGIEFAPLSIHLDSEESSGVLHGVSCREVEEHRDVLNNITFWFNSCVYDKYEPPAG